MTAQPSNSGGEFGFVQALADNLSSGSIELPSFPEVVIRLRQVLADEESTTAQIGQLLAAEPSLAARLLTIANSAALRPGTTPISDLNMVINRCGRNMVRNAAMSFAMKQVRETQTLEDAQLYLREVWSESTHVAALCYVLAKKFTNLNPDEALLVGLLHNIGKLYILAQAESHPDLFNDDSELRNILREWHTAIGKAILENWKFSEEFLVSVSNYEDVSRAHDESADLTDVLTVAYLLATLLSEHGDAEVRLGEIPAGEKLAVSAEDITSVLQESEEQISSLRRALGE